MGDQRGSSTTGREGEGQDNVVQLPRDWLGPREELVPFGPRAWAQDVSADPAAEEEGAFAADDFWGENSESLHTAVRGPVVTSTAEATPGGLPAAQATAAPVIDAMVKPSRPAFSLRIPVAAAVVVVATVAAVAVLVLSGGARPGGAPPVIAAGANAEVLTGHLSSTAGTIDAGVRRLASLRLNPVRRQHRHPAARRVPHRVAAPGAGAVGASSGGGAAPSMPAPTVSSSTQSSAPSSTNAPATSAPSGASGDSAGASSNGSSPSNQPAFGANGTLGPGSSPNG